MSHQKYSAAVKARCLALCADRGGAEASRATGVPAGTVRSWAHRAGIATVAAEKTRAVTEAAWLRWEERRLEMADRIGEAAEGALTLVGEAINAGDVSTAKNAALTLGILIDKAELLVGSRANLPERPDPERLERRERELDELERRRLARSKRT